MTRVLGRPVSLPATRPRATLRTRLGLLPALLCPLDAPESRHLQSELGLRVGTKRAERVRGCSEAHRRHRRLLPCAEILRLHVSLSHGFLYILSVQCRVRIFVMESVFFTLIAQSCVQQEQTGGGAARRAGGRPLHPGRYGGALLALRAQPAPQGQAAGKLQLGPLSVLLPSLPLSQEHPNKSHDMRMVSPPRGRCERRDVRRHLGPAPPGVTGSGPGCVQVQVRLSVAAASGTVSQALLARGGERLRGSAVP